MRNITLCGSRGPPLDATLRFTLEQWRNGVRIKHISHAKAAAASRRKRNSLGVPATILATVAGASGISTLGESTGEWAAWLSGVSGIVAAVLAGLQTYLGYETLATSHEQYAADYGDLRRELDVLLAGAAAPQDEVQAVRARWHELDRVAPTVPASIHRKAQREVPRATKPSGPDQKQLPST